MRNRRQPAQVRAKASLPRPEVFYPALVLGRKALHKSLQFGHPAVHGYLGLIHGYDRKPKRRLFELTLLRH
jgi:hypothetical protein